MEKFKSIKSLYKIERIEDDYIVCSINQKQERVYVYEVIPCVFLDVSDDIMENVIACYNQFLRQCDFNLQIVISNTKLDIDSYISTYLNKSPNVNEEIYLNYIDNMRENLENQDIFETKIYIIVSENLKSESKIHSIENTLKKLEEIGCALRRIDSANKLEDILYKTINKV